MIKFVVPKSVLFALILCLCVATVPAQDPGIILPPLPSVMPPDPPDPETLPPPPQLEWEPLGPKDSGGVPGAIVVSPVPPPQAEAEIAPPPPPIVETPLPVGPDAGEIELAKPDVEIWRLEGDLPQIPARRSNRLDVAYMTGTEPVWLRVQFDPQAAGKSVYVRPGYGITVNPPRAILTVASNGECLVLAQLANGMNRSHLIFYCDGVRTVLPVMRAALPTVEAKEEETGGGQ
jgi:hypothetical protein